MILRRKQKISWGIELGENAVILLAERRRGEQQTMSLSILILEWQLTFAQHLRVDQGMM